MKQVIFMAFFVLSLCPAAFAKRIKSTVKSQDENKLAVKVEEADAQVPPCCNRFSNCCQQAGWKKAKRCGKRGPPECRTSPGSGGWNGGWRPPPPFCAGPAFSRSVRKTAECIFNDGMTHGGWAGEFPYLAGPDGQLSFQEWSQRVGNTHASAVIFVAMATQEDHHHDRPDMIDLQDWKHFMQSAQRAVSGRMDATAFGDYVSARVTAEMIFEVADGHGNLHSNRWEHLFPGSKRLTTREWRRAYHYVNDAIRHRPQDKITPYDLMNAIGLSDVYDVFKVFEFFESLGDTRCGRNHGWEWLFGHQDPNDGHEIDKCEWNQLPPFLQSKLYQYGYNGYYWDDSHGISAGFFSEVVARMSTSYFASHSNHGGGRDDYGSDDEDDYSDHGNHGINHGGNGNFNGNGGWNGGNGNFNGNGGWNGQPSGGWGGNNAGRPNNGGWNNGGNNGGGFNRWG